ncbi:hypothetical protein [Lactobacillus sp. PV012]|uniref:hypothetical protein n=1 Tax=Lactobacillus sp. PV012 TaxID=2594494 RepID=UPI00223FB96B|nr:hypothetical protein [Lactobacillus sp. PV012]QNQ82762.1 hypothetical protein FP433_06800 [Lactobacillus sp. PV012]
MENNGGNSYNNFIYFGNSTNSINVFPSIFPSIFAGKNVLTIISLDVTLFLAWFGYFKKIEVYQINILNEDFDIENFLINKQIKTLFIKIILDGENTGFIRYRGVCFEKDLDEIKNKSKRYEQALWGQNFARGNYVKIKPHEDSTPIYFDLVGLRREWKEKKPEKAVW